MFGDQIGETKCEIVSVRICAPSNCGMVPSGTEKCHNKTVASIIEVPEEVSNIAGFTHQVFTA